MPDDHNELLRDWRENATRDKDANFRFLRSLGFRYLGTYNNERVYTL